MNLVSELAPLHPGDSGAHTAPVEVVTTYDPTSEETKLEVTDDSKPKSNIFVTHEPKPDVFER